MTAEDMSTDWIWAIAIVILGVVLPYVRIKTHRRSQTPRQLTDAGTKRAYEEEERREKGRQLSSGSGLVDIISQHIGDGHLDREPSARALHQGDFPLLFVTDRVSHEFQSQVA